MRLRFLRASGSARLDSRVVCGDHEGGGPPPCECGGAFKDDAPPRCPNCRLANFKHDPEGSSMIYD